MLKALILVLILAATNVQAQSAPAGQSDFVVTVGPALTEEIVTYKWQESESHFMAVNYSNFRSKLRTNLVFGLGGTVWLLDRIGIGTELTYQKRAASYEADFATPGNEISGKDRVDRTIQAVALPLYLSFRLLDNRVRLDVSSGVEYAMMFGGERTYEEIYNPPDQDLNATDTREFVSEDDIGWMFRVSSSYPIGDRIDAGVRYTFVYGVTDHDASDFSHESWRSHQASVFLSIHK